MSLGPCLLRTCFVAVTSCLPKSKPGPPSYRHQDLFFFFFKLSFPSRKISFSFYLHFFPQFQQKSNWPLKYLISEQKPWLHPQSWIQMCFWSLFCFVFLEGKYSWSGRNQVYWRASACISVFVLTGGGRLELASFIVMWLWIIIIKKSIYASCFSITHACRHLHAYYRHRNAYGWEVSKFLNHNPSSPPSSHSAHLTPSVSKISAHKISLKPFCQSFLLPLLLSEIYEQIHPPPLFMSPLFSFFFLASLIFLPLLFLVCSALSFSLQADQKAWHL